MSLRTKSTLLSVLSVPREQFEPAACCWKEAATGLEYHATVDVAQRQAPNVAVFLSVLGEDSGSEACFYHVRRCSTQTDPKWPARIGKRRPPRIHQPSMTIVLPGFLLALLEDFLDLGGKSLPARCSGSPKQFGVRTVTVFP